MDITVDKHSEFAKYAKHPVKELYLAYQVSSTLLVRLPFWTIVSLPPNLRPRREWKVGRCVRMRLLTHAFDVSNRVGGLLKTPTHLAIIPGVDVDAEWIEPDPTLILGQLATFASAANVEPCRIPGYWMRQTATERAVQPGEKVLFSLHGGAYVAGSASPGDITAETPRGILKHTPSIRHAFSPEYRLSSLKGNPFPTALLDAVAAYAHLLRAHKVSPKDVVVEGDSAGGNLALALTRYLVEHREQLEPLGLAPPGALLLISPWSDLGESHRLPKGPKYLKQSDYFVLDGKKAQQRHAQAAFAGPAGLPALDSNPYISPASKALERAPSFKDWPRTFINCGGAEALAEPIRLLRDRMAADLNGGEKGEQLTYYEAPNGVHVYIAFPWHEPERTDTLKAIATWVDSA
jgi:acetyl esterase/lipase